MCGILSSSWAENRSSSAAHSSCTGRQPPTLVACHPAWCLAPPVAWVCPHLSAPDRAGPGPALPSEQPWELQAGRKGIYPSSDSGAKLPPCAPGLGHDTAQMSRPGNGSPRALRHPGNLLRAPSRGSSLPDGGCRPPREGAGAEPPRPRRMCTTGTGPSRPSTATPACSTSRCTATMMATSSRAAARPTR